MARRNPSRTITDAPDMTPDMAATAVEIPERGTALDWSGSATGHWSEFDTDQRMLISAPERTWVTDVQTMLERSGKAASVLLALSLPIRQANLTIEKPDRDRGQTDFVREELYSAGSPSGMRPDLTGVVSQMVEAIAVKRTYHEIVWRRRDDGRFGYRKIAWRPPSTCELIRDRATGDLRGFRQFIDHATAEEMQRRRDPRDVVTMPKDPISGLGYVTIPAARAAIHIHGQHRDPVNGVSDLSVTHWAYTMQQKILLMWSLFLDGQAQPKVFAYGDSKHEADSNARAIASLRGSGVLGMKRPDDETKKVFEVLDTSGKGAEQFAEMVRWLDQEMTRSVLAGFLDLTSAATGGVGSYALSQDQSGLFLTSRQAAARELSQTVTDQIIAPLVRVNFGADAAVPRLRFEKMEREGTEKAMQMLQQLGSSQAMNVPSGFLDLLVERVAQHLDLPDDKVEKMLEEHSKRRREQAEAAGRSPGESESDRGRLTDTVNAGLALLRDRRREPQ